jgi:hypothetical protein
MTSPGCQDILLFKEKKEFYYVEVKAIKRKHAMSTYTIGYSTVLSEYAKYVIFLNKTITSRSLKMHAR